MGKLKNFKKVTKPFIKNKNLIYLKLIMGKKNIIFNISQIPLKKLVEKNEKKK